MALPVKDIVNVEINLSAKGAQQKGFGHLLLTVEPVLPLTNRLKSYSTLAEVVADFGTTGPVYSASVLFFSQTPTPKEVYVGRTIPISSRAQIVGAKQEDAAVLLVELQKIIDGTFTVDYTTPEGVKGTAQVTTLDLSTTTSLAQIGQYITSKIGSTLPAPKRDIQLRYVGDQFIVDEAMPDQHIESYSFSAATTPLMTLLKLDEASGAKIVSPAKAETLTEALAYFADLSGDWFTAQPLDLTFTMQGILDAASFCQASTPARCLCLTTSDAANLDSASVTSLSYLLSEAKMSKTVLQYSLNAYAIASYVAKISATNYNAAASTITMKFKTEPGVTPENLTSSQAKVLRTNNCNMFVKYDNDTAIIQEGVMCDGEFSDTFFNLEWLKRTLENTLFNTLYQAQKISQTEQGTGQLLAAVVGVLTTAKNNGSVAPGTWALGPVGQLNTGDYLANGWYAYCGDILSQPQAEREARKAPPIYVAIKLGGAMHSVDVLVTVNR